MGPDGAQVRTASWRGPQANPSQGAPQLLTSDHIHWIGTGIGRLAVLVCRLIISEAMIYLKEFRLLNIHGGLAVLYFFSSSVLFKFCVHSVLLYSAVNLDWMLCNIKQELSAL